MIEAKLQVILCTLLTLAYLDFSSRTFPSYEGRVGRRGLNPSVLTDPNSDYLPPTLLTIGPKRETAHGKVPPLQTLLVAQIVASGHNVDQTRFKSATLPPAVTTLISIPCTPPVIAIMETKNKLIRTIAIV